MNRDLQDENEVTNPRADDRALVVQEKQDLQPSSGGLAMRERQITVGAKVSPELVLAIDKAILANPQDYTNRSDVVRACLERFVREQRIEPRDNARTAKDEVSQATEELSAVNHKEQHS